MRVRLPLFAAALALLSASAAAQPLRIATEGAYPPWNSTDTAGALVGFEVDLIRDLCRRLPAECSVVGQDWDGILPGLQQGQYDAVIAGVAITDERRVAVDFTRAYAADPAVFVVKAASPLVQAFPPAERIDLDGDGAAIQRVVAPIAAALAARTVGVQTSTTHAKMMEALFPAIAVRGYERFDAAALDLAAGRVDALLGSRSAVEGASKTSDGVTVIGPAFSRGVLGRGVGIALRKGDALVDRFNAVIEGAAADGTTAALSKRWFGYDVSLPPN